MLSDYLCHVVNVFVYLMLQSLIILLPQRSNVHYFSDGAQYKYKNFKNLTNPIHHLIYGKSPCDNIGGTVTRLETQSNFQNNHILNADLMYD